MKIIPYTHDMEITENCFVSDMPEDIYHAWPDSISKSGLDLISRSPAHYLYAPAKERTRFMVIGSAIHCALLEPERFEREYLLLKGVSDRRAAAYKEAIKSRHEDYVLVSHEADNVRMIQASVFGQYRFPDKYHRELSAFAIDPVTGILLRARFDILTDDGIAIDIKKTQKADRVSFAKSVANYRYHVQDACYSYVYELITGEPLQEFKFLAIEEQPPHVTMPYVLCEASKMVGMDLFRRDLTRYAECVRSNKWPGYEKTDEPLSLPNWAFSVWEDEQEGEIV